MEDERYQMARERVLQLKGFYSHLVIFTIINALLFLINWIFYPGSWWFLWVTLFWGIGLCIHGLNVFGRRRLFSRDWEEKKIRQYMDEEEK